MSNIFLYKFLDFENQDLITEQLKALTATRPVTEQRVGTNRYSIKDFAEAVPDLHRQFIEMGCELDIVRDFVTAPNETHPIHIDGSLKFKKKFAINWPLENCIGNYMQWFTFDGEPELVIRKDGAFPESDIRYYTWKNSVLLEELELSKPALVNIEQYHAIKNPLPVHRKVISFRFFTDLSFMT